MFQRDSSGREHSSLIDFQSIRQIDLTVKRIDGTRAGDPVAFELIPIHPSPDRCTVYIRNYVGKNVASFGYTSLGGERREKYGEGNLKLNFVSDDGAYLDPGNPDLLRRYVVTAQNVAPNSEMKLVFQKDSRGNEYSSLVESQTYQSITLYVRRLSLEDEENPVVATETGATAQTLPAAESAAVAPAGEGMILSDRDVRYRVQSDGNVEICGVTHDGSSITIPSEIGGRRVMRIADGAFENCTSLRSLLNWADLTHIGARAFKGCTGLKEISIPGETVFIGESAFEGCTSLKNVILWGDPVRIEKNTFRGCTRLTDISLPGSVRSIEESAFENCSSMSSVVIWGNITSIGKNAFRNCAALDDISIPSSCREIGESAFEGCSDLDTVILWGETNIGDSAFRKCTSLEEISISSGTQYIGDHAFEGCASLESVILWGRSTRIGKDAFAGCPKLRNVPR